jgi:hypothetical protein
VDKATWLQSTFANKKDPFLSFFRYSISWLRLKNVRNARDPVKFDAQLATKVIVPFHSSFCCVNSLHDKPVTRSDSSPLSFQDIFTMRFCVSISNGIKKLTKRYSAQVLFFVSSSILQPDPENGAKTNATVPSFLSTDALPLICLSPQKWFRSTIECIFSQ